MHHLLRAALPAGLALTLATLTACVEDGQTTIEPPDAGSADAGPVDTGPLDAVQPDAVQPDAAQPDVGASDAAPPDSACSFTADDLDPLPEPPRHTPRWAFEPWISKDISDRADTLAFVQGFRERDIPVGVVVLDSPWETHYNTFVPSPERYGDFEDLVAGLRADGVRTVLWITQMINQTGLDFEIGGDRYRGPSPNLAEAEACGFLVEDGRQFTWWKGLGAGIDFFDPLAMAWWHQQQNRVLDAGIAGWKLDFGEEYIKVDPVETAVGPVPHQQYSEAYYRDFLAYGVQRNGVDEFVTMVRPYDKSYEHEGRFFARPEHTPVGWVGDNRRSWEGLIDALDHLFRSAAAGYVVIGSDIGGYLDFEDVGAIPGPAVPFEWEVFARWTAQGALTPFMQLHGRANLTPWNMPAEDGDTVAIYRDWSWLHQALIPFWYSLAEQAYRGEGGPIMRPIGNGIDDWTDDWRYMLGEAFLVAPLFAPGGARDVALPAGYDWYDWWAPAADALPGGQTVRDTHGADDFGRIPLYVREGALVPLNVVNDVNGLGQRASEGHLTLLAYPGDVESAFTLIDDDERPTRITAILGDGGATVALERTLRPVLVRVKWHGAPIRRVTVGEAEAPVQPGFAALAALDGPGWWAEEETRSVWIRLPAGDTPVSAVLDTAR